MPVENETSENTEASDETKASERECETFSVQAITAKLKKGKKERKRQTTAMERARNDRKIGKLKIVTENCHKRYIRINNTHTHTRYGLNEKGKIAFWLGE